MTANESDPLRVIDGGDPIQRQAASWFARLRADDVSDSDRRRWQQWLARDPRHRTAYERIERLWSGLGEYAPHPEIERRLRAGATLAKPASRRRSRMAGLAAAAALVVAIFAGWQLRPTPTPPDVHYATAVGELRAVTLADGSRVSLDTDTRLRVRYSDDERRIALDRGRAFFRIAKERRPLSVHTGSGSVQAVGTEFEVVRHDEEIEVTLIEGRVRLLSPEDAAKPLETLATLDAGQRARFGKRRPIPQIETVPQAMAPSWLSGRLVFDDTPLAAVIAEFNRYAQRRIVLGDAALEQVRISGVFRSDDPSAFIEALHASYAISAAETPAGELALRAQH